MSKRVNELNAQIKDFEDQKKSIYLEMANLEDAIEEMNIRLDLLHEELDAEVRKVNELNKGE